MKSILKIVTLSFLLNPSISWSYASPFNNSAGEASMQRTQNQIASHFNHCVTSLKNSGQKELLAKSICRKSLNYQLNKLIGNQHPNLYKASIEYLICLEEQSTLNGTTYAQVRGLCATLTQMRQTDSEPATAPDIAI